MPVFTRSAWIPRMQTGVLSAPVPAVVGMAISGLRALRRRATGTDRRVEVLGQVAVVRREQVHRLGRVDHRPPSDVVAGDRGVPVARPDERLVLLRRHRDREQEVGGRARQPELRRDADRRLRRGPARTGAGSGPVPRPGRRAPTRRSKPVRARARPVRSRRTSAPSTTFVTAVSPSITSVRDVTTPGTGAQLGRRLRAAPRSARRGRGVTRPPVAAVERGASAGRSAVDGDRDRLGRRPDHRPVVRRERDPEAMAGQERVRRVVELDPDRRADRPEPSVAGRRGRRDGSGSGRRT